MPLFEKVRYASISVQFYVLENNLELYARFMLLLGVVLKSPDRMGLQGKIDV